MATLEERIERLSQSVTRGWLDTHTQSRSLTAKGEGPGGRTGGTTGPCWKTALSIPLNTALPGGAQESGEMKGLSWSSTWGLPPELGPDVDCFLQEPAHSAREDSGSDSSPEPPAEQYKRWVTCCEQVLNMPEWWQELVEIPEEDDYWELAQMIQASFELPWWVSKLHDVENYYLAPPASPCLCWKDFLLLPPQMVAYAQALQFWVEKSNLPTLCQPCLLAGNILELRKMMEPYVSFFNDAILDGVAPLEGFLKDQFGGSIPESAWPASTDPQLKRLPQKKQPPIGGPRRNQVFPRHHARNKP